MSSAQATSALTNVLSTNRIPTIVRRIANTAATATAALLLFTVAKITAAQNHGTDSMTPHWTVTRSANNPLLTTETKGIVAEHGYPNVNGPSVIRVPYWIERPLGRYYMYFAHHRGSFIRLAYADSLEGPWNVSNLRVLRLDETAALDHIASPDVHVDEEEQLIRMYFHSVDDTTTWYQTTYVATSADGLDFEASPVKIGPPYIRVFQVKSDPTWWAIAKVRGGPGGVLLRGENPNGPFEQGPLIIPGMRHAAVLVEGKQAHVFFSRIGDAPERLLATTIDPGRVWIRSKDYASPEFREVMEPEMEYEGAGIPIEQSAVGEADEPVNALRDPAIFSEDGVDYLFYSIAGENGIAVARLDY